MDSISQFSVYSLLEEQWSASRCIHVPTNTLSQWRNLTWFSGKCPRRERRFNFSTFCDLVYFIRRVTSSISDQLSARSWLHVSPGWYQIQQKKPNRQRRKSLVFRGDTRPGGVGSGPTRAFFSVTLSITASCLGHCPYKSGLSVPFTPSLWECFVNKERAEYWKRPGRRHRAAYLLLTIIYRSLHINSGHNLWSSC